MSEHWKSTPKYWCKHCSSYVKDTPFEKKQHESTGKHQGNLKRFLRDIQNNHEREEREKQKAKAEVDRVKKFGGSLPSMSATPPPLHKPVSAPNAQASIADRKRQMAQLIEMGVSIPDEERGNLALVGDWKVTARRIVDETPPEDPLSMGVRKRKYEGQEEEEEAGEVVARRGWGSTTRAYPNDIPQDLDDLLSAQPIKKVEPSSPKLESSVTVVGQGVKEDSTGGGEEFPEAVGKKEPDGELSLDNIPLTDLTPRFKKRKPKVPAT